MHLLFAHIAILLTCAAAFAIVFLLRRLAARRRRGGLLRSLHEVAAGLGAAIEEDAFAIDRGGARVTARLERPLGGPPALQIATSLDQVAREPLEEAGGYRSSPQRKLRGRPRIEVRRETRFDRIAERLWIARRARSGDEAFDRSFWIASEAEDADTRAALSDARTREAIERVLASGADQVTVNEQGALLSATLVEPKEEQINIYAVSAIADGLAAAAKSLPTFGGGDVARPRFGAPRALLAASVAAAITAPLALWAASRLFPLLEPRSLLAPRVLTLGLALGIAAWALLLPLLALFIRRRPGHLASLLGSAAALLLALPILGAAGLTALNGLLDTSAVERPGLTYRLPLRPIGYDVSLPWWRSDCRKRSPEEVRFEAPEAAACVQNVTVVTGDGRLGSDWLRGVRCAPPRQDEALKLEHVGYHQLTKSLSRDILLDVRLRNDHDEPRWILVPTLTTHGNLALIAKPSGTIDVSVERRDAILIAHMNSTQQRFIAVFLPPYADVKLDALPLAHAFGSPPKLITLSAIMARRLTFGGRPGEEWLSADPLPADVVRAGISIPSLTEPPSLEIDQERLIYSEVLLDR